MRVLLWYDNTGGFQFRQPPSVLYKLETCYSQGDTRLPWDTVVKFHLYIIYPTICKDYMCAKINIYIYHIYIYINIHITILSSRWSFQKTYVCWMLLLHDNHANWSSSFSSKSGNTGMFRRPLTGHRRDITGISPVSKPATHFFRIVTSHSSGFQNSGWLGTGHHVFSYQGILVHLKGLTCTFPITHQEIRKCLGAEHIPVIYAQIKQLKKGGDHLNNSHFKKSRSHPSLFTKLIDRILGGGIGWKPTQELHTSRGSFSEKQMTPNFQRSPTKHPSGLSPNASQENVWVRVFRTINGAVLSGDGHIAHLRWDRFMQTTSTVWLWDNMPSTGTQQTNRKKLTTKCVGSGKL